MLAIHVKCIQPEEVRDHLKGHGQGPSERRALTRRLSL